MSYAPEPSPAPTLAGVPGYYFPETPDSTIHEDPLDRQPSAVTESSSESTPVKGDYAHRVNNAVGVAMGAAAGFLVGGPVGSLFGGGIVGLVESENDGLKSHADELPSSTIGTQDKAFDVQSENSQHALEESPAQKLVNPEDADEGSKLTGAGALGGTLLAGGAGAKVAENEVAEPNEEHSLTPIATRSELPEQPAAPEFGTPVIEKEQAELAHSPAQRLLGERSESTVGAENILLAGGTGAVIADREIEEPTLESPEQEVATSAATTTEAEGESEPLERQVSSIPNPAPETPRPTATTQPSTSSFTAAVLAAGTGIGTPTREDVPLSMTGSTGVHPLVQASDQSMKDTDSGNTATPEEVESSAKPTTHTHPNIFPVFPQTQSDVPVVSDKEITPELTEEATIPASAQPSEEIVHNPPPHTLEALTPASTAVEPESNQPRDFQPYSPPIVGEDQEEEAVTQDKGKGKEKEVEYVAAGAGAGVGAAVIAHELREKRSIDSTEGGTSSQPGSIFQENFTPQPQPVEYNPLAVENQRAIPPQQAQGDPVLVMPSALDKGKGKAIDPEDLQSVPATSPEQAGFAPGAPKTIATEEFAHLSQPAPQAEIAAQQDVPQTSIRNDVIPTQVNETPSKVPAVAGTAVGAAAPLAINNNATSAQLSQAPPSQKSALLAQQPTPAHQPTLVQQPAPIQQTPLASQQQAPVVREKAQPSRVYAAPTPVQPQTAPQSQIVPPTQQQSPVNRTASPHGLAEGVERSPHMRIQTHSDEGGHKKLHRKSLAADTVPLVGIGKTKASKPDKSHEHEVRRDRLMDSFSGVPDPTLQRQQPVPAQMHHQQPIAAQQPVLRQQLQQPTVHYQQQQPGVSGHDHAAANRGTGVNAQNNVVPPPVGAGSHVQTQVPARTSAPSSPTSPTGHGNETVHRKLSKSKPRRKSNASVGSEKGGFLGKVFGRHSRSTSGSVDGGSNRGSLEMQRPAA